ncbi:DUF3137 domain-containing protein [Chachezhania antarctica]|uniref:DUF3137 domain-containing protein n=1 Tax=Chachezhania antarctica TaxID=2340860 RepID=UPI000EAC4C33|nr:DUF3137 domain-containing protein [Chachezhania antarctica]|tara:strand:+ start:5892 stop:6917 length:1026 start_codon:yes stop_codon:yes gene_type:complete
MTSLARSADASDTTEFTFVERESYEAGFAEVYQRLIVPYLRDLEARRKRVILRSQRIILIIALVALFLAWQAYRLDPILPIMPIAFGAFGALFVYLSRGDKLRDELTTFIRPVLSDFLHDVSFAEKTTAEEFRLNTLERLCLVPKADRRTLGPRISGSWRGVSYTLTKARFAEEYRDDDNKSRTRTLFNGILIEVECWNPMPTIVYLPDFGELGNKVYSWATRNVRPPHRLDLSDDDLERTFEVYTDDPEQAQKELDTDFGRKILHMSEDLQGVEAHMPAAFEGHSFFMAVRLPHGFLNFNVMDRPMSEVDEKIHQAFRDLTIPRRIIDRLLDWPHAETLT